ncbi:hypothetical protein RJ640_008890 [Escallonia rubra]|uniref:ATP synthase delta chain, chloroplastic n=1 Tax=Escallonia rubra TaxID=112253 RepID=A0AA88UQT1_9ASTE|nr:hypothetical protein RJ640_008890 [Escallonia rubra]
MDALPSSVSSFKVPAISTTSRELYHLKPPTATSHLPPHPNLSSASTKLPNSISSKSTSFAQNNNFISPFPSSDQTLPLKQSPLFVHRKPASGYAAALIDAARSNNSLQTLEKDIKRFAKYLRNEKLRNVMKNPAVKEKEKGQIVKEVAEQGKFHKYLVVLVKMLVEKNKLGMVGEVLEEFERFYDEMSGTQVVLVSSMAKMEEEQLLGIARRVQKISGALKVKVRHWVQAERPLSFAV